MSTKLFIFLTGLTRLQYSEKLEINKLKKTLLLLVISMSSLDAVDGLETPPHVKDYLRNGFVTEGGELSGDVEQTEPFTLWVRGHWSLILYNLAEVAPTTREKQLIIGAAETLPGREYLQFLRQLKGLVEQGKVETSQFSFAILSFTHKKRGFLGFNYEDSEVRQLCDEILDELQISPNMKTHVGRILSGDGADDAWDATVGMELPAPEKLESSNTP